MAGDLIVVIPGIGGSVLHRGDRTLWDLSWRGFAQTLFTGGSAFEELSLSPQGPGDGVQASGLIGGVSIIPGFWSYGSYRPLTQRLEQQFGAASVLEFPYDWRRSNAHAAQQLHATLDTALRSYAPDTQIVLVAHSMGGLVARGFLATSSLAERCRMLITIGTPYRGAVKALDALVNGVRIPGGVGRALTGFLRTLPSVYELLPTYDCLLDRDGTRTNLAAYTSLVPDPQMLEAAIRFHEDTNAAFRSRDPDSIDTIAVVGQRQRTAVLARHSEQGITLVDDDTWTEPSDGDGRALIRGAGDGTVPRGASQPPEWGQRVSGAQPFSGRHVNLPQLKSVWNAVHGAVTGHEFMNLGGEPDAGFGIGLPDTIAAGDELILEARHPSDNALALDARVTDLAGRAIGSPKRLRNDGGGSYWTVIRGLNPGFYEIEVAGNVDGGPRRVSDLVTVYPEA